MELRSALRPLLVGLGTLVVAGGAGWALAAADDAGSTTAVRQARPVRDVLDTPAAPSVLASRTLHNGLARAGDRIISVGQRGHIVYSDDDGQHWTQAEVPVSSDLVAVHFPTAADGWAVGHDGVVLHTSNGGQSWSVQLDGRSIDPGKAEDPFLDVWFRDARHGYVVGAFGMAYRTTDGGARWTPITANLDNPKGLHLYAVRGIGQDVYIAGEQGLLLKQPAGEARFQSIELPYKGTLFGLTGADQTVIVHGLRGTVLRSGDSGRQWQQVPTGLQVGLTGSTRGAKGQYFIVSQAGHLLASHDDGATFQPLPIKGIPPAAAVAAAAHGTLVVAGPRGVLPLQLP
ncbi:YCF48-related protein [Variovorax dokdonensis]|uniref:YCF48-related protein n=1 Tax=Variovorax dokdonensis TaxID=344883 RepID=A0ABT7N9B4_9BURK|nr:YCF48-related protein [Variovorax dokdonensis]MDM0044535.1 YCF48-related protein [Variovorax dokdonensis]